MSRTDQARDFAIRAHGPQLYGGLPYIEHLDDVAAVLREFGIASETLQCAAFLHDVVEDTDVSVEELDRTFGSAVSDIVDRVTRPAGIDRADDVQLYYPRVAGSVEATCVKLADRIANWRYCRVCGTEKGVRAERMYSEEYPGLRTLRSEKNEALCGKLWQELDRLYEHRPA